MKFNPNMSLKEYKDLLFLINRRDQKELLKSFDQFYADNRELIDNLENQRISGWGNGNLKENFDSQDLYDFLSNERNLPLCKGKHFYTPSGYFINNELSDGIAYLGETMGTTPILFQNYEISLVESFGGEGKGEDYWFVLKILNPPNKVRYFKFDGYYNSYDGASIERCFEVGPTPVMEIEWNRI